MARRGLTVFVFVGFFFATGQAQIPQTLSYQGLLTDTLGTPLPDGSYNITFRLYQTSTGGSALWQEARTLQTKRGVFFTNLGDVTPLGLSFDRQYWLGIQMAGDPELTPRMALTSSGYSLHSKKSDTASYALAAPSSPGQWNINGSNISYTAGNVGIGTTSPGATLEVYTAGNGISTWGGTNGVSGNGSNIGVYGLGTYGIYGTGTYGVYGFSSVNGGAAVYGNISGNFGTYGGYFQGDVRVERNLVANGISSISTGLSASSGSGPGVVASGTTNGVEATGGTRGIYASGGTYGVVGVATSNVFPSYGIYGSNNGSQPTTYAGFFDGSVKITNLLEVNGFIYKNGGGFKIDHPIDPANKYLYHSFVESPDMKNIYDGLVMLDEKGEAIVNLPDWFGVLNSDFRYQLTAVGAPGPNLYIAEEIVGNRFKIGGGTVGMKVSWQVTGIRQDAYAKAHRIPVEEEKTGNERGKYRNPKELGVSETLGIHYEETQKMVVEQKKIKEQLAKAEQASLPHEKRK